MGFGISNSKILAKCDRKARTILFLRSPRRAKNARGHNPDNKYAEWRNPMRDARRKIGWPSGRQWVKFRKFGAKAYRAYANRVKNDGMLNTIDGRTH